MRKIVFTGLLILIVAISFCREGAEVYATNTTPDRINVYITDIKPKNLCVGQLVEGTVRVEVTCSGDSSVEANPAVDFGDSNEPVGDVCHCFTIAQFGLSGEPRTVTCDFDFSHTYNATGTYSVTPSVSWGGGVGPVAGGGRKTGPSETVVVTPAPSFPPATTTGNPLAATTTTGIVNSIINIIFYIVSALAVLLIMIGGFTILTAAGSPLQVAKGRKIIVFTIMGYSIMAISRGILALIYQILGVNAGP